MAKELALRRVVGSNSQRRFTFSLSLPLSSSLSPPIHVILSGDINGTSNFNLSAGGSAGSGGSFGGGGETPAWMGAYRAPEEWELSILALVLFLFSPSFSSPSSSFISFRFLLLPS